MKFSLAVILTLALAAPAEAITVRGARSCGNWVSTRLENAVAARGSEAWLIGYLSGIAIAADVDLLRGTDNDSLFLWMDNYCKANPLKDIADGSEDLSRELIKSKKR